MERRDGADTKEGYHGKKKVLCNRKNMVRVNEDQRARRLRQVQDIRM